MPQLLLTQLGTLHSQKPAIAPLRCALFEAPLSLPTDRTQLFTIISSFNLAGGESAVRTFAKHHGQLIAKLWRDTLSLWRKAISRLWLALFVDRLNPQPTSIQDLRDNYELNQLISALAGDNTNEPATPHYVACQLAENLLSTYSLNARVTNETVNFIYGEVRSNAYGASLVNLHLADAPSDQSQLHH